MNEIFDIEKYKKMTPAELRTECSQGRFSTQTSGLCAGYAQANLLVLPEADALEFVEFAKKNPASCPILEHRLGRFSESVTNGADIATAFPKYRIWQKGKLLRETVDVSDIWKEELHFFLIGCSFSFEAALIEAGIPMRHIDEGKNVSMYLTNIPCHPVGKLSGNMVVSMRPMTPENAALAHSITSQMPRVHGAPIQIGSPEAIGIADVTRPDFGDAVSIYEGEIPVFWPCGVTPQSVVMSSGVEFAITHAPGHMLVTDVKNKELMEK